MDHSWKDGDFVIFFSNSEDEFILRCLFFPLSTAECLLLLLSCVSRVRLCATPETAAHQAPRPWDSPGKNTGVGCHFLLQSIKEKSESEVTQSCPTPSNPMTPSPAAHQAPLYMGFSRQEYWSGVPLPSPQNV